MSSNIFDWLLRDEIHESKVIVCTLNSDLHELLEIDFEVYKRFYPATQTAIFTTLAELRNAVNAGYDIVHLLCDISSNGFIADNAGNRIYGTDLITECCNADVKLLWIASDNRPEGYVKNFRARGKRLNLVMTISRNGRKFPEFVDKLLFRMSLGETMPVIWADLAPQIPNRIDPNLPSLIFYAGRGGVKLR